jgi:Prokaryotic E2 family E
MTDEPFLPEDDQDFLRKRGVSHRFHTEGQGDALRRAIEFIDFAIPPNLFRRDTSASVVPAGTANILVLIPKGYSKAKLDSWYIRPALVLANGGFVDRANSEQDLFGQSWQFWSRHLDEHEWRPGVDGLEIYLQYIRAGLRDT